MQIVIQAACSRGRSMRDLIARDPKIEDYQLTLSESKRPTRPRGWAKLHGLSQDLPGAVNVQWDAASNVLLCRVVTRTRNPGALAGQVLGYLLSHHRRRLQAIHVVYSQR
jgi:hypothetical protein